MNYEPKTYNKSIKAMYFDGTKDCALEIKKWITKERRTVVKIVLLRSDDYQLEFKGGILDNLYLQSGYYITEEGSIWYRDRFKEQYKQCQCKNSNKHLLECLKDLHNEANETLQFLEKNKFDDTAFYVDLQNSVKRTEIAIKEEENLNLFNV